jgi:hypothetical protein
MRVRLTALRIIPALILGCLASMGAAEPRGVCSVHKGNEIKCTIGGEKQGFLVDIHPDRPHVRASITTFWTVCGISRKPDFNDTYVFAQESARTVWYRYNKAFWPVHGSSFKTANCIEVYIHDCADLRDDGTSQDGACSALLTVNGFTYQQRP